ncbi:extracellular solute-binding protein [Microbacterium sp. B2969]|uniref:Extracellular solute-binding protein n=1 Tax=Microbacterium alkaliflavum TaxID=3248839 RepID=A0ABW7Q2E2_9MICO
MGTVRKAATVALVAVVTVLFAGCSGGASSTSPTDTTATLAPKVKVIDPAVADGAEGSLTVCGSKDNSGAWKLLMGSFAAAYPGVTANYQELGPNTTDTHNQAVQRVKGGNTDCDVYATDVTWTAEWASQGWVYDQSKLARKVGDPLLESAVATTEYAGRNWATPFYTNAGLLYYRDDRVAAAKTLPELYKQAAADKQDALLIALSAYEGLTTNFLEVLYSAGGSVLDSSGKVVIDSKETKDALTLLKKAVSSGAIDPASLTYDDGKAATAYASGAGAYLRNWPSVYNTTAAAPALSGSLKVQPLPAFDASHPAVGVLGGWNLMIPLQTKNLPAAVALVEYASGEDFQKELFLDASQAPVYDSVYTDPQVLAKFPFAKQLHTAVTTAKPRPVSPVYPQISQAIYDNVYAVISGQTSVEDGIKKMTQQLEIAQATF